MDEIRAQTAVHNLNHNLSTVKLELTSEDSFFHSQRHFQAMGHSAVGSHDTDDFGINVPNYRERDGSFMATTGKDGMSTATPRRRYGKEGAKYATDDVDDLGVVSSGFSAMFASRSKVSPRDGAQQQSSVDSKESTATYLRRPDLTFRENDDDDDDDYDDAQYAEDKFDTPGTSFRIQAFSGRRDADDRRDLHTREYNEYIASKVSKSKSTRPQQHQRSSFITSVDGGEPVSDVSDCNEEEEEEVDGEGRTDRGDTMRRFKRALAATCGTGDPYAPSIMSTSVDGPATMISTSNFHTVYSRRRDDGHGHSEGRRNHHQVQVRHSSAEESKHDRDCRLEEVSSPGPATPVQWLPSRREQGEDALRRYEQQDRGLDSMNSTFSHLFQR